MHRKYTVAGDPVERIVREAFLLLFFGAIDGDLAEDEKTAIRQLLADRDTTSGRSVDSAMAAAAALFDSLKTNVERADALEQTCATLGQELDLEARSRLYECCVDVACADGRFHDREARLLAVVRECWKL